MFSLYRFMSFLKLSGLRLSIRTPFAGTALFLGLTMLAPVARAQQIQGTLAGIVTDPNSALVPGCRISVTSQTSGEQRIVTTSREGAYSIPLLAAGEYSVTAEAPGFKTGTARVTVGAAQTVPLDFQLSIGETKEVVETSDVLAHVALSKDSHEISNTITEHQLQNLPAPGRSILGLVSLTAGAQPGSDERTGNGSSSFFGTLNNDIVLSGQSIGRSEVLQDGVSNVTLLTQTANIVSSVEAVQEVHVETNGMSARFSSPGNVNLITRSGTNTIHGMVFDFLQNDALNARYFFARERAPIRSNQFGGNIGGPLLRNKLFGFFAYAGRRQSSAATRQARVPTAEEARGDFSTSNVAIYDPQTYNASTGEISPFPGNVIPQDRINTYSARYLGFYPKPTGPIAGGLNFLKNVPTTFSGNQFIGKVDYNLSPADTLSGSVSTSKSPTMSPSINPDYFGINNDISGVNAYLQEIHTISQNIVNVGRFGYNRSVLFRTQQAAGTQNFQELFGLENVTPAPEQSAPPLVTISGLGSGLGDANSPQGATQNLYQLADEVNWTLGRHRLFFGADVKYYQFDGNWTVGNNGSFTFNGQYAGNHKAGSALVLAPGIADLLLGYPSNATVSKGITVANFREYNVAAYIQDDWKARSNLTVNLGLRYEYRQPPTDTEGIASTYLYQKNITVPGTWRSNYLNFGPRVGLAWSPTHNTVIRAGFGIYFNSTPYNYLQFTLTHPPNYYSQARSQPLNSPVPWQRVFSANPTVSSSQPFTLGQEMRTPYVEQWNFNIQRSLSSKMLLMAGYVGNVSHHQSIRLNANQAVPAANPTDPATQTVAGINSRRPYPNLGDVYAQFNIANANYHGLQASFRYALSHGFSVQASYAWSKALNVQDSDQVSSILSGQNLRLSYGPANFDRTHVLRVNSVYELPTLRNAGLLGRYVAGGWQVSGVITFGTGLPFSATANDLSYIGGVKGSFANRSCNGYLEPGRTYERWFDTRCFSQPGVGQLGNAGRNSLRGPSQLNFDLAAFKRFPLSETVRLEFRSEMFNAFNHPQLFSSTYQNVNSSTFGRMSNAENARTIQMAVKVIF